MHARYKSAVRHGSFIACGRGKTPARVRADSFISKSTLAWGFAATAGENEDNKCKAVHGHRFAECKRRVQRREAMENKCVYSLQVVREYVRGGPTGHSSRLLPTATTVVVIVASREQQQRRRLDDVSRPPPSQLRA